MERQREWEQRALQVRCVYIKEEAATLTCHSFRNQIVYTLITINAKVRNYSPFSILALRAARASFSPSEVVAAWFWIVGISLLLALLARGLRGAAGVSPHLQRCGCVRG